MSRPGVDHELDRHRAIAEIDGDGRVRLGEREREWHRSAGGFAVECFGFVESERLGLVVDLGGKALEDGHPDHAIGEREQRVGLVQDDHALVLERDARH